MDFLSTQSVWVYLLIFVGKNIEVTFATVRMVLINRGERLKGAFVAFFEVLLWIFVTGTVLVGFKEDLLRVFVFAIAFASGNYLGSWLESKLAFGLCSIQVITPKTKKADDLVKMLRDNEFAVTVIDGKGKERARSIMLLHLRRKRITNAVSIIKDNLESAMITVNDTKVIKGGFIKR